MKLWMRYAYCITLGLVSGAGLAAWQVSGSYTATAVRSGPWSANTNQGMADASALTRAKVAINGIMALPPKEAMYYIASTDSDGAPLDGKCTYTVRGGELDARWWSVTLYQGKGWLVKNAANIWSIGGNAPARDELGNWSFTVSPKQPAGTWLPTGGVRQFDLTLRTYHPRGALLNDPARAKLPSITKETCA